VLFFICQRKFFNNPADAVDLTVGQMGNIQAFAVAQTQKIVGGDTKKFGKPDQNIKRGIIIEKT